MDTRPRIASYGRAIGMLIVSVVITAAVTVAMLIDTLAASTVAAPFECWDLVHPVAYTTEFIDPSC